MLSYVKLLVKLLLTQHKHVNLLLKPHFLKVGELFCHLCQRFTCRQIYYLYLCLDIVAVKQKKMPPHSKKRKRESLAWQQWHMILWWQNIPSSGSAMLRQTIRFFRNASPGRLAADEFVASAQAFCARKQPLESKNDATVWHDSLMNKQHPVQALQGIVRQSVSWRTLRQGALQQMSS